MVSSSHHGGYELSSAEYFGASHKHGVSRSSLCEARAKVDWRCFQYLLTELNREASATAERWRGHRVFAVDGTRLQLPRSVEILRTFTPAPPKGHYPQALMVSLSDVFSGTPLAASVHPTSTSEREQLCELAKAELRAGDICLLDRGFEGRSTWGRLDELGVKFIARVRAKGKSVNKAVAAFLRSGLASQTILETDKRSKRTLTLRLVRFGRDYKGGPIVLLTNLVGEGSAGEIRALYLHRWRAETLYYRLKKQLCIEKFQARTLNGIQQEIWAHLFLLGFTTELMRLAAETFGLDRITCEPNFKNSVSVVRRHLRAIVSASLSIHQAEARIARMLEEIARVRCRKQSGRKNPRISHQPYTTWSGGKKDKDIARDYAKKCGA